MQRSWMLPLLLVAQLAWLVGAGGMALRDGMSREEVEGVLGRVEEVGRYLYLGRTLPEGPPGTETATLVITPEEGLCRVQATSGAIATAGDGASLRQRFDRLLESLWATYGGPRVVDEVAAEGGLEGKERWMAALLARQRVLMTVWTEAQGARLPEGLVSVVLSARALSEREGYLNVDFTFASWPGCQGRIDAAGRADALPARHGGGG